MSPVSTSDERVYTLEGEDKHLSALPKEQVNTIPNSSCWYLQGRVEELEVNWLMDCGANPNILSEKVFRKLPAAAKSKLQPANVLLVAANGEDIITYGQTTVKLQLEGMIFYIPVVVADIGATAGILGMRFLRDADCSIAFKGGVLRSGTHQWKLVSCPNKPSIQVVGEEVLPEHIETLATDAEMPINEAQRGMIRSLLHRYANAFATPDGKLGSTNLVRHSIDTGDARPIKTPYRPPTFAKRTVIDENLDQMLANKIIEPSNSPWSSPVVLAKKKDGSNRFCVDLRRLNEITRKDAYPLPNIQDCLSSLAGAKWFCTLDLASGYWQVDMNESDKEKTAFATHRGLFQFRKMAFGLTNAPATFMRLMEKVLEGLNWEQCLVYLDDIIVFGETFDQCLERLGNVVQRIQDAGLKLKPGKCHLFRTEVSFLGHVVTDAGIACDPEKIDKVREWPAPESTADVKSFLGLANYYKRFIQGFSDIAKPLTELTGKNKRFHWDNHCEQSFQALKEALTTAPILAYPSSDPNDLFILDTDASNFGMGAVLSQVQDGTEYVIAYASKGLSRSQRNYCTTYRELLALVEFITHFKHFLLGRKFVVRSDHSSLRWLLNFKDAEGLVGRWLAKLANYDFDIEHRAGVNHGNADAMSRNPAIKRRKCCGRT